MARKRRLDPGGFAYGELSKPAPGQSHRDAPLSRVGRIVWWFVLGTILLIGVLVVVSLLSGQGQATSSPTPTWPPTSAEAEYEVGDVVADGRPGAAGNCVFDSGWEVGGPVEEGREHGITVRINDNCDAVVVEVSSRESKGPPDWIPWRSDETPELDPTG